LEPPQALLPPEVSDEDELNLEDSSPSSGGAAAYEFPQHEDLGELGNTVYGLGNSGESYFLFF
jgi:hypothetical protein